MVSVIMPVRNEQAYIERALSAVLAQDYPQDRLEVVIADGMSEDDTRRVIAATAGPRSNVRIVDNRQKIAPTGMNAAMACAGGEIVIRVDGHCEIEPNYVRRCVEHLCTGGADGVGGAIETIGETPVARMIAVAMSSRFGVGGSAFRVGNSPSRLVDTVPFPAYTRSAVQRAGPYDEELVRGQDDEYNYRLRHLGGRLLLAADVRSRYYSRSSLRTLARQYYQYGFWKVRVLQQHPRQMCRRQFVPPAFVAGVLALAAACPFGWLPRATLAVVLAAYALVNLAASAAAAPRVGSWTAVLLPVAYALIHFSYGWGFLRGLVAFRRRWSQPDRTANQEKTCGERRHLTTEQRT